MPPLADALGAHFPELPIESMWKLLETLARVRGREPDTTEENLQLESEACS